MDRTTTMGGNLAPGGNAADAFNAKVEGAAQAAHHTTDRIAEKAHHAVDNTADATKSAARWAATFPEQARQIQTQLAESASASIRARPLTVVAGAVIVGYLLGRLARL